MKIAMIAAMADNRVIGKDNGMPWHLPADLKHFKQVTLGKPVIMGRKTYESIGKALPGRTNIVISRSTDFRPADAHIVASPDEALIFAQQHCSDADEIMVIGGGAIYQAMLNRAERLYLTFIDATIDGDTQFPDYTTVAQWQEVSSEQRDADDKNPYACRFVTLQRQPG
ncbi:type 3 dihydrofolate reductase [Alteromonas sp. CYL-A6]|uniref:type 3 dihydrofolate reductase n=1 Tax=Alteromonas nitratireducens TaxID=3390813 RepID=UPI0034B66129